MTTYVASAVSDFSFGDPHFAGNPTFSLVLRVPAGPADMFYTYPDAGTTQAEVVATLLPGPGGASAQAANLNADIRFEEIAWGAAGHVTRVMFVACGEESLFKSEAMVFLGGDPLPIFTKLAAYERFLSGITDHAQISGGDFAPGQSFDLSLIPGADWTENDTIDGMSDPDHSHIFRASLGDDLILGGALSDRMFGNTGNDRLEGQGGQDFLYGGFGRDTLSGNGPHDVMFGGGGQDEFYFHGNPHTTTIIRDFQDNIDTLLFDRFSFGPVFWHQTVDQVLSAYASVGSFHGHDAVVFDFGNGDIVIIDGVASIDALRNDIVLEDNIP